MPKCQGTLTKSLPIALLFESSSEYWDSIGREHGNRGSLVELLNIEWIATVKIYGISCSVTQLRQRSCTPDTGIPQRRYLAACKGPRLNSQYKVELITAFL